MLVSSIISTISTDNPIWVSVSKPVFGFGYLVNLSIVVKLSEEICMSASVLLFLASCLLCWKRFSPSYLKTFPGYTFVNAMTCCLVIFIPSTMVFFLAFFPMFELCYFSYFFILLLPGKKISRNIVIVNIISLSSLFFMGFRYKYFGLLNFGAFIECAILIPLAFIWFRHVFRGRIYDNLAQQPSYWFATGILLYCCVLFPSLVFCNYVDRRGLHNLAEAIYSVNNYTQVLTYILFIIGMLCRRKIPS